jgi:hypothetical protein
MKHIKNSTKHSELKISLSDKTTIDVIEQRYDTEKKYWQSVIELIQYLLRQCIAFRGSSKKII